MTHDGRFLGDVPTTTLQKIRARYVAERTAPNGLVRSGDGPLSDNSGRDEGALWWRALSQGMACVLPWRCPGVEVA